VKEKLKFKKNRYLFLFIFILIFFLGSCSTNKAEKKTITVDTTKISIDESETLPSQNNRVYTTDSEFFDTTGLLKKTQNESVPIEETIEENGKNYQLEFVDPNKKNNLVDLYYKDISEFISSSNSN